jgi:P4 family phage/plasmid primase-like protien
MNRNNFLKKLFSNCDGHIELRAIMGKQVRGKAFVPLNSDWQFITQRIDEFCQNNKDINLYFGIATRDGKGGCEENVISISCVWAEMDYKNFTEEPEARIQGIIDKFPFKPSIIISSGAGVHLYWLLKHPVDLKRSTDVREVNGWIQLELNKLGECRFDNIGDTPRILRLPDTVNHKYSHKPVCEIVEINDNVHRFEDFLEGIPASEKSVKDISEEPLKELYSGLKEGSRNTNLTRLVGSWANDGLTFDECMDNARMINMKTSPPMSESEIASIINSILKKENAKTVMLLNGIHNTELGNSQRLTNHFGDLIRYCGTWKKWLVWDDQNGAWQIDDNGQVQRLAKRTLNNIFLEASKMVDSEERRNLLKWGLASESASKIQAMIKLAESEEGIAVAPADLDINPWLLNCHNGTIDLRTGQLKEHDKGDLITKSIPVIYDPNAKCPIWEDFLVKIMDRNQGLISFLQRIVGYSLTGDTREQCFFILHGNGANGKSTFIKTIGSLLGDYAQAASFETFLSKKQGNMANNDIARMHGKRFISAVEAEESRRLAENVIKQVTGGDVVAARFLYAEYFEFIPQFKIFLATNHKPKINCNDPAIWRRVKLVPFAVRIPEMEQIQDLDEQLKDELPGILNWALSGVLDWQNEGLRTPVEVENATKKYRNEMDTVSEFLNECCDLDANKKETPTTLYDAYKTMCELNGEKYLCLKNFGKSLNDKGFSTNRSNGKNWRIGIKLLNQDHDFDQVSAKSPDRAEEEIDKLCAEL